jgi:outer membrane protein assembly factor BamA
MSQNSVNPALIRRHTLQRNRSLITIAACTLLTTFLHADCAHDHRSSKNSGLLITDFTNSGTQTLTSGALARIKDKLIGSCFNENSDELLERVRALFQDEGYFGAVVNSLHIKLPDPLALPKPAMLEADVLEGQRYKVAEIRFTGNHASSAAKLRSVFPLKRGDLFQRDKVAGGLESIRKVYASNGFIDLSFVPQTQSLSNATIVLTVAITEGPRYRMGKLEILAKKDLADRLSGEWQLAEGAVFDFAYIEKYVDSNRSLLPRGFTAESVQLVRDCRDSSVEVRVLIEATDVLSQTKPKDVECEPQSGNSE